MDSRFLESFVLVARLGSIAEAARHLDLTSASVSMRVKALEATFSTKLVLRSGRTVRPTVAGQRILARAEALLSEIRDLKAEATDARLPAGPLRLGSMATGLSGLLPPVLKRWVQVHPQVEIFIEPGTSTMLYEKVIANELDGALLGAPLFDPPKTCKWRLIREERLILLTPAWMPVDDPLEVLATEPFIRSDRASVAGKMVDHYLRDKGIQPQVRFELDGIEPIAKLVSEGLGVSILPDWLTAGGTPLLGTQRWPLPDPCPARKVGLIWLRSGVRAGLVDALAQLM